MLKTCVAVQIFVGTVLYLFIYQLEVGTVLYHQTTEGSSVVHSCSSNDVLSLIEFAGLGFRV